ncbi:MAG TPA: DNA replication/repair protein RecF [Gammaproteobacteria bacterium]|nr:DNA replication/repair protein RecF [Gammaproteobacteria bacterium]|tara:strand:+ start:1753 stop:2838 length:1086 start_codon:yes stop_codon:yes gene_type:complete
MQLTALSVQHVRRICAAEIYPSKEVNLISGQNGSGKTSFLESIHYLATARSFRTTRTSDVISHGQNTLVVNGKLQGGAGQNYRVGIEKTRKTTRLKLNGEIVRVSSKIARLVPVLTFNTESHLMLNGGPANRRALLDRLLFHVEPRYLEVLKDYYRALKQRNTLLRTKASRTQVRLWDTQLAPMAAELDGWRGECISTINRYLEESEVADICGSLRLEYQRGWPPHQEYEELLATTFPRDREVRLTTTGPHRAELRIFVDDKLAKTIVSRGQGKLIIAAIICAQAQYLRDSGQEEPILLIDDLSSELDRTGRNLAAKMLLSTKAQTFFTAIDALDLPAEVRASAALFHVEHGKMGPMAMVG